MGAVPLCSGSSSTPQTSYLKNVYHHVGPRCVLARRSFMVLLSYLRNNSQNRQEPLLLLAQTNLYIKAIELVCGGSPFVCVLIERKTSTENTGRNCSTKPVWITCLYNTNVHCTVMCQFNGNYLRLPYAHVQRLSTLPSPSL